MVRRIEISQTGPPPPKKLKTEDLHQASGTNSHRKGGPVHILLGIYPILKVEHLAFYKGPLTLLI